MSRDMSRLSRLSGHRTCPDKCPDLSESNRPLETSQPLPPSPPACSLRPLPLPPLHRHGGVMAESCVICLGASGQALAGKRCRASACKAAYSKRLAAQKTARLGQPPPSVSRAASPAPSSAGTAPADAAPDLDSIASPPLCGVPTASLHAMCTRPCCAGGEGGDV